MLRRSSRAAVLGALILAVSFVSSSTSSAIVAGFEWGGPGKTSARTAFNWRSGVTAASVPSLSKAWGAGGGTFTPPILVGDTVVVGDNGGLGAARLRAFDAETGDVLWTRRFGSDTITRVGSPSSNGSLVHVTVERETILGWIYDLYAYDLFDGSLAWSAEIGVATRRLGPRDVLFTAGRVITPTAAGNGFKRLAVYNANTGAWLYSVTPGGNISAFAADTAVAYVATKSAVEVYDLDTGSNVNTILGAAGATSIIVSASGIYVTIPGRIVNYDSTGFITWSKTLAAGCTARARVLTNKMFAYSHKCAADAPPGFTSRGAPTTAMNPVGVQNGDRPIASGRDFMIAVSAAGVLKAWDTRDSRLGFALTMPSLNNRAVVTSTGGPIVADSKILVPESGGFEVFAA